ncbi:MAG: thioredoxin family protein [Anaerolineae bacterium]|nr:thioredoxin family protein [Anaerolineae bacterium]
MKRTLISAIVLGSLLILAVGFVFLPAANARSIPLDDPTCTACTNPNAAPDGGDFTVRLQATPTPGDASAKAVIYMFWGNGCPHCALAKPFLEDLAQRHPEIEVQMYEVYYDETNLDLFRAFSAAYGFEPNAVPTIFMGEQYWVGFSDALGEQIETATLACAASGCQNKGAAVVANTPGNLTVFGQTTPSGMIATQDGASGLATLATNTPEPTPTPTTSPKPNATVSPDLVDIPIFGRVDLSKQSLFISTLLISFVDGFNPCSIWVLTMLLAITLHTGSRKKVLIIGAIFISVTALIYALFIAGLFTVLTYISFVGWIRVVVALVSLFFALVNIKDYFFYQEGVSFTISADKKPGLFQRMRRVIDAGDSLWAMAGGTVVLAAGVSLVEFSCTAGFPVLWTNMLSAQSVTAGTFILLLLVYLLIYQLDEMGIFLVAVFSLRASRIEEKHGRLLKLIGGMLMLTLAVVMLVNPTLLNTLSSSLLVFGVAFGATLLVLLLHRVILPRLGIYIGSEHAQRSGKRKSHKRR